MIYFTSDTHFNHANIIRYCNRPFGSAEEMNGMLIHYWNSTVQPDDTIFHLGDFTFGKDADEILPLLRGFKILVPGNHDPRHTRTAKGWFGVQQKGWKVEEFTLSHHPDIQPKWGKLLHGHMHSQPNVRRTKSYALDVGVDAWGMKPVSIDEVRAEFLK